METIEKSRDENLAVVRAWMTTLGEPAWWDLMHEDIVLEFPYGPSLGQPERIVGRAAASAYVKALIERAGRIKFYDLETIPTTDAALFVNEYRAQRTNRGGQPYVQIYINKVRVQDGKVVLMREFWDPKRIVDSAQSSAAPPTEVGYIAGT